MTTRKLLAITFVVAVVLFWMRYFGLFELTFDSTQFAKGFVVGLLCGFSAIAIGLVLSLVASVIAIGFAWTGKERTMLDLRNLSDVDDQINPVDHEQTR